MPEQQVNSNSKNSDSERQIRELNQLIVTLQRRAEMKRKYEGNQGKSSLTKEFFEGVKIV